jgi:2-polyprenyl-3-methyl-5-hydroxy-6-metoxy-1,4-benzoquinol methylase
MLSALPKTLDWLLMRHCGLPYTLVTRDRMIHERMRYLIHWVAKENRKVEILDAGCGSGLALLYLDRYCRRQVAHYTGIDLSTKRVASRYNFVSLPHSFQDLNLCSDWTLKAFDTIFCSEVIEHIVDDRALLVRLAAHLAPEGLLLLTTPNKQFVTHWAKRFDGFDQISSTQDGGHVRTGYDRSDLEELANDAGLAILDQSFLSRMRFRELRHREKLRKHGQHVNTARHNWTWLVGSMSNYPEQFDDVSYWTVAAALVHRRFERARSARYSF